MEFDDLGYLVCRYIDLRSLVVVFWDCMEYDWGGFDWYVVWCLLCSCL